MINQQGPDDAKAILQAFSRTLMREAHVLTHYPNLLWQQMYNNLQWKWDTVKDVLSPPLAQRRLDETKPWLKLENPYRESRDLLRTLKGNTTLFHACVFSPDGQFILSGCRDGNLRIWEAGSGSLLHIIKDMGSSDRKNSHVKTCDYSPDGNQILSGHRDEKLRLWDSTTGQLLNTYPGPIGAFNSVAFSPDGCWLVSTNDFDNQLHIWSFPDKEVHWDWEGHRDKVNACCFSPDGKWIVSASNDNTLRVWHVQSGVEMHVLNGHQKRVTACAFSPDGALIVSASEDKTLRVWDSASGEPLLTLEGHLAGVECCTFSPDACWILSGGWDQTLRIWDRADGKQITILEGHSGGIYACSFSPDGRYIISAGEDEMIRLWDSSEVHRQLTTWHGHEDEIRTCSFSPDGRLIVSTSQDYTIRIWDHIADGLLHILEGHIGAVNQCLISPDGHIIVSSGVDGTVRIWSMETGELIHKLNRGVELEKPDQYVSAFLGSSVPFAPEETIIACSSNGRLIGSAIRNTVKIWDGQTGECLHTLNSHTDEVSDCKFSPDGHQLASASRDKTILVWNTNNGQLIHTLEGSAVMMALTFSPDGAVIVSAGGGYLCFWDTATGEMLKCIEETARGCVFSPDGCRLVSYSFDRYLQIWDPEMGTRIHTIDNLPSFVKACIFSPDGQLLISIIENSLFIWDTRDFVLWIHMPLPVKLSALCLHPFKPEVIAGDSGGALYHASLVGIRYGAIVSTIVDRGSRLILICPACQKVHSVNREQLGTEMTCPTLGCGLILKINPFVIHMA